VELQMKIVKTKNATVGLLLLLAMAVQAAELPQQKLGLWQRTTQTTEDGKTEAPEKSQRCVDADTLETVKKAMADAAKMCTKHDIRQVGGKWTEDSVCNLGTTTLTVHGETVMKGDTEYHSETDSTYSPALHGAHSHTVAVGVWLGPCKPK
jgi:hypothetical protein